MPRNELETLVRAFGKAYFNADKDGLKACTTPDFEWHQHIGSFAPDGNIIAGVDDVCAEILRRKKEWSGVKYDDFSNHFAEDMITSLFRVSGVDENGEKFDVRAVDLYTVRDGKIARKDSYWKQITG
ncbi:MAG: nuclear transport factor 2 family protein [Deltaproteobacteria bacterium]|nr:nuclear transport factor 2 family protein [Deltaproteobacteria bacterium]